MGWSDASELVFGVMFGFACWWMFWVYAGCYCLLCAIYILLLFCLFVGFTVCGFVVEFCIRV